LRLGEIAVIDLADREPSHGEIYLIENSMGRRCITQLLAREMWVPNGPAYTGWFTSPLSQRQYIPGLGHQRMVDGPRDADGIKQALIGRVIGLARSIPITA
jgi:hypothetical protein